MARKRRSRVAASPASDSGAQPEHADLVEKPETEHHAQRGPARGRRTLDQPDDPPGRQRPEEDVERVHRVVVVERQVLGSGQRPGHGERHGPGASPERPRQETDDGDGGSAEERREQSQCEERIAQQGSRQPEAEDGERWVVDVAGRQVVGAGEVVELVPEVSVPRAGQQVERELRTGKKPDQPPDTSGCGFPHSPLPVAVVRIRHAPPCPGPPPPSRPCRAGRGGGLLRRSRERQRHGRRQRRESLADPASGPPGEPHRNAELGVAPLPARAGPGHDQRGRARPGGRYPLAAHRLSRRGGHPERLQRSRDHDRRPAGARPAAPEPARGVGAELDPARPVDQSLARPAAHPPDHGGQRA